MPPEAEEFLLERFEVLVRRTFIDFDSPSVELRGLSRCRSWPSTASEEMAANKSLEEKEDFQHVRCKSRGNQWHREDFSPALSAITSASTSMDVALKDADSESDSSTRKSLANTPAVTYLYTPTSARAAGMRCSVEDAILDRTYFKALHRDLHKSDVHQDEESCQSDGEEDICPCPAYSSTAELPSVGSAAHEKGSCRRCCFFPKGRCTNGMDCEFCHFAHLPRLARKNKKKNKKALKATSTPVNTTQKDWSSATTSEPVSLAQNLRAVPLVLQTAIPVEDTHVEEFEANGYECYAFVPVPMPVQVDPHTGLCYCAWDSAAYWEPALEDSCDQRLNADDSAEERRPTESEAAEST